MFRTVALFLLTCISFANADCQTSGNTTVTCLDVTLWDMFGDGWDGAKYYLQRPSMEMSEGYPTCDINPVYGEVCPDEDGLYYMVVQTENESYIPHEFWEIYWTVSVPSCNSTNNTAAFYTGGFNTTMVWHYEHEGDEWTLVYWQNLWPNTKECDACGNANACPAKPKPSPKKDDDDKRKHKKGGDDKHHLLKPGHGHDDDRHHDHHHPKPHPRHDDDHHHSDDDHRMLKKSDDDSEKSDDDDKHKKSDDDDKHKKGGHDKKGGKHGDDDKHKKGGNDDKHKKGGNDDKHKKGGD